MTRHITWEVFSRDYIRPAVPAVYRLSGSPSASLYVSDKSRKIGIRIEVEASTILPAIPFKEIALQLKAEKGKYFADLSTSNSILYEHFYSMVCSISDSVQLEGEEIDAAIISSVERLKNLVSSSSLLSDEKIVGIWGELWVLEELIAVRGPEGVFSWKGPDKAIHDFRLEGIEIEVKTTRNEDRVHLISRLTQLEPSPEMRLLLCSIQIVESATEGLNLPERISEIEKKLIRNREACEYFFSQLKKEGYSDEQKMHYQNRYYLRSTPELVEITDEIPRLGRELIASKYGAKPGARISNVHYSIDITGLGVTYTDPSFQGILTKEL